ncbi:MAG: hypothetical protein OIF35_00530 [Cellvibrionaceae bacterium]|nr:hypothetical protein [Cellvibrionaceae bacterium]MCV6625460.1 hypothetical protein [Cellvibrionaceae bacterium]
MRVVTIHKLLSLLLAALLLAQATIAGAEQERLYYRYIDRNGVQVIRHAIPPEYVQGGYEVVTLSGRVVRDVKPAPSAEEKARMRQAAKQAKLEEQLQRRYASVEEVERAKGRKLDSIDGSIQILRGNIAGIETRIQQKRSEAANLERAGRPVNDDIIKQLKDLNIKRDAALSLIERRQQERRAVIAKYDEEIALYNQINAKAEQGNAE